MIRFACPSCKHILTATADQGGSKLNCPQCGQRLQVPQPPPPNKTILGALLPEDLRPDRAAAVASPKPAAAEAAAPPKGKTWFWASGGQRQEPVSWEQLRRMAASGQLKPMDLVWTSGMRAWVPAREVEGLMPPPPASLPPLPPPAQKATSPRPGNPRLSTPELLSVAPAAQRAPRPAARPGGKGRRPLLIGGALAVVTGLVVLLIVLLSRGKTAKVEENAPAEQAEQEEDRELATEELVARCKPSVARIRGTVGGGTGFLARPGILVTNSHVISQELTEQIKVFFPSAGEAGKTPVTGELLYEDPKRDLAILRVKSTLPALRVAGTYTLKGGQRVVVIGSPAATAGEHVTLENAVTQGVMSTETSLNELKFYQISATINPGNSGGPVFDARGRVIGVVTRKAVGDRQEGLGFAIPLADLHEALRKIESQSRQEIDRVISHHNAATLFRRLARAALLHGVEMKVCSESISAAMREGRTAQQGFNEGQAKLNERFRELKKLSELLMKEVEPQIPRIVSDLNLSESTRRNLDRLLNTYTEMQGYLRNPRSAATFLTKTRELVSDCDQQVEALKKLMGVKDLN